MSIYCNRKKILFHIKKLNFLKRKMFCAIPLYAILYFETRNNKEAIINGS